MLFSAEITDCRIVYNVLKAISFKEFAIVRPMDEGLKITLDEMKCVETSVYVPCTMFTAYHIAHNDIVFRISLKVLTECLNIFGDEGSPSLKFSYRSAGSPLCLIINHPQENVAVDCEISTMNVDDANDMSLADECNQNKVVISADILAEMLQRLDHSADEVRFELKPTAPHFTLTSTGLAGESEVNIGKHAESITVYQCTDAVSAQYSFQNIRHILRVMALASKVAISTGDSGLLGLQLMINADDKQMYVEYYVTSQFMDD